MESNENNEKKSFKWIVISFAVSFLLSGSLIALSIYVEEQQRPGLTENLWTEILGVFLNPYLVVAGVVGVIVVGAIRLIIKADGFSAGGKP